MAMFCALHDVEAEKKGEVTTVEGPRKALKAVNLEKPRTQVRSSSGTWTLAPATT